MRKKLRDAVRYCTSCDRTTAIGSVAIGIATLAVVVTFSVRCIEQTAAVALVEERGVVVYYDFETKRVSRATGDQPNAQPAVIAGFLGRDFCHAPDWIFHPWDSNQYELTDADVARISELRTLRRITAYQTNVTDASLSDLLKLNQLSYLQLQSASITDEGLLQLSRIKNLRRLQLHNADISRDAFDKFSKRLPICFVTVYLPNGTVLEHAPAGWNAPDDWPAPWVKQELYHEKNT